MCFKIKCIHKVDTGFLVGVCVRAETSIESDKEKPVWDVQENSM